NLLLQVFVLQYRSVHQFCVSFSLITRKRFMWRYKAVRDISRRRAASCLLPPERRNTYSHRVCVTSSVMSWRDRPGVKRIVYSHSSEHWCCRGRTIMRRSPHANIKALSSTFRSSLTFPGHL